MTSSIFRRSIFCQYLAYLLIALVPLQAAAAGRLALCATGTTAPGQSHAAVTMEHCSQTATMKNPAVKDIAPSHQEDKSCWLGSVCLASVVALALPAIHQPAAIECGASEYLSAMSVHYRSVVLDDPQRPPTIL